MLDPDYHELDEAHYRRKYVALNIATLVVIIFGALMLMNSSGKKIDLKQFESQSKEPALQLHDAANKLILIFTIIIIFLFLLLRMVASLSRANRPEL